MSDAKRAVQTSGPIPPALSATDQVIDAWFIETFHNLALPVELYARFFSAKERLKAALRSPPAKEG